MRIEDIGGHARGLMQRIESGETGEQIAQDVQQYQEMAQGTEGWFRQTAVGMGVFLEAYLKQKQERT